MKNQNFSNKIGGSNYVNKNCWLVSALGYPSLKRCWYCRLKFRACPFFEFLIISVILVSIVIGAAFFLEQRISRIVIISLFLQVPIYGFFFNRNTEAIIESNFVEIEAKRELEKAKRSLEKKVQQRTKELKELTKNLDQKVKEKTQELQSKLEELEKFEKVTVDRELKMIKMKKTLKRLEKE